MRVQTAGIDQILKKAQDFTQKIPSQLQEFQQVLEQMQEKNIAPQKMREAVSQHQKNIQGVGQTDQLYQKKLSEAQQPEGLQKLMHELESGYDRLNKIVEQIRSGKSFSPQELIALQGEMHQITVELEAVTKVVSQVVQGVRTLLQQQV